MRDVHIRVTFVRDLADYIIRIERYAFLAWLDVERGPEGRDLEKVRVQGRWERKFGNVCSGGHREIFPTKRFCKYRFPLI